MPKLCFGARSNYELDLAKSMVPWHSAMPTSGPKVQSLKLAAACAYALRSRGTCMDGCTKTYLDVNVKFKLSREPLNSNGLPTFMLFTCTGRLTPFFANAWALQQMPRTGWLSKLSVLPRTASKLDSS